MSGIEHLKTFKVSKVLTVGCRFLGSIAIITLLGMGISSKALAIGRCEDTFTSPPNLRSSLFSKVVSPLLKRAQDFQAKRNLEKWQKLQNEDLLAQEMNRFLDEKKFDEFRQKFSLYLDLNDVAAALSKSISSTQINPHALTSYAEFTQIEMLKVIYTHAEATGGDLSQIQIKIEKRPGGQSFGITVNSDTIVSIISMPLFMTPTEVVELTKRNFIDPARALSFRKGLNRALSEGRTDAETLRSILANFGWTETSDRGFPLKISSNHPEQTILAYRGMRLDHNTVMRIFQEGEVVGNNADHVQSEFKLFKNMSNEEKENWIRSEKLERISGLNPSNLIGMSLSKEIARTFGAYVFELRIPREARIPLTTGKRHSDHEKEIFVPFGIHPSWIKSVIDTATGEVIARRP